MLAVGALEAERLRIQSELDLAKSQTERNRLGQFATPPLLARDILTHARSLLPPDTPIRFLDPAFGTGAFYSALLQTFPLAQIVRAEGYEVDPHYGRAAIALWNQTPLQLRVADFTQAEPPDHEDEKVNLLICNPPYVRHHHLSSEEKERLQRVAGQLSGVKLNGLAGLYCYFLCIAHAWMEVDGLAGWLIPSEFMDVNYGQPLKAYLQDSVTLLQVHRFSPEDVQFDDAIVSSAVVWFRNAPPPSDHAVAFTYGGTLAHPRVTRTVSTIELRQMAKWTQVPLRSGNGVTKQERSRLADFFKIKRGLATGANQFFILTHDQVNYYQLPRACLTPILPSPRYLPVDEVQADEVGDPVLDRQLYLVSCHLPEGEVRTRYPSLWRYLQRGVEAEIHQRYLCRHRTPWYAQENRPPAPILCTYMGRRDTQSGRPFRFILNHSKATAPNVYLMLYPQPVLQAALRDYPDIIEAVWRVLNQTPFETLNGEGRVYGGGLHKLEPNELGNVPADGILAILQERIGRGLSLDRPVHGPAEYVQPLLF